MTKKRIVFIVVIILIVTYFYPRNSYKILHSKVGIRRIETVKVTTYSPGLGSSTSKTMSYKFEREEFWDELRKIKAIRFPILQYVSKVSEENMYYIELSDEKITQNYIVIDDSLLIIEGNYYLIIDKGGLDESVFVK